MPRDPRGLEQMIEWLMRQLGDLGPISGRSHWFMVQPPLGESTWPVKNLDSSLAR